MDQSSILRFNVLVLVVYFVCFCYWICILMALKIEYWTHWITLKLKINIILSFVLNWRLWEVGNRVIFREEVYYYYHLNSSLWWGWSNNYVMLALTFSRTHFNQSGQEMISPPSPSLTEEHWYFWDSPRLHIALDLTSN